MTQEEKELLLKDLCARLPHKQKVCYKVRDNSEEITETLSGCLLDYFKTGKIAVVKSYLRPMSSLTEEELNQLKELGGSIIFYNTEKTTWSIYSHGPEVYDWLNKHHFDYRGLVPMGLALEAPKDMYKIE